MTFKKKPFFHSEDLKPWDRRYIYAYMIIAILSTFWYTLASIEVRGMILVGFGAGTPLVLYFFLYTSLRNLKVYLIWCAIGICHLIIYLLLKDDESLLLARGHAAIFLRNTIIFLLLFQFLRYISVKLQHREFVVPTKNGGRDLLENKKPSEVDYLILIIYMGSVCGVTILSLNM